MGLLIWTGAALTLAGVAMLGWCIVLAMRAKNSGLPDDQIKASQIGRASCRERV